MVSFGPDWRDCLVGSKLDANAATVLALLFMQDFLGKVGIVVAPDRTNLPLVVPLRQPDIIVIVRLS